MLSVGCLSRRAATAAFAVFLNLGGDPAEALYDVEPGEVPGKPGTIIRVWPLEGGGPGDSDAFRFLYRSTGPKGEAIPVSGAIFIPSGPAPVGGRNVIAWAHPTSGVMPPCAPSLYPTVAELIWNLPEMVSQGYVVVATDYPGLGTDGIHPYLIGESEGRAVLDSVRAAQHLTHSGTSNRFAVWGHSQGGHAALYTGELAARYAPELVLVGVAAAAPATYIVELLDDDETTEQDLIAMASLLGQAPERFARDRCRAAGVGGLQRDRARLPYINRPVRGPREGRKAFAATEVSRLRSVREGAVERDHGAQFAGSGPSGSTGLHCSRNRGYDGRSTGH
jgi:hypothetical protein